MITEQQEQNLIDAQGRTKRRQDRTNPMVININDGRLMPNTPRLRVHPNYRVYTGDLKASLPDRMSWVAGVKKIKVQRVVDSTADEAPFDIGKADKDEMLVFAMENYGEALDPSLPLAVLRKKVAALASKTEEADLA
jgi:hypothetical protein